MTVKKSNVDKPKVKKRVVKKKTLPAYTPKSKLSKMWMNRDKKKWKDLKTLNVEIGKFFETCFHTREIQVGYGKTAYFETTEYLVATKGTLRMHLGVSDDNIKDWKRRDNKEHQEWALTIAKAELFILQTLQTQAQSMGDKTYLDAVKWIAASTYKIRANESTKEKVKAMKEVEKDHSDEPTKVSFNLNSLGDEMITLNSHSSKKETQLPTEVNKDD